MTIYYQKDAKGVTHYYREDGTEITAEQATAAVLDGASMVQGQPPSAAADADDIPPKPTAKVEGYRYVLKSQRVPVKDSNDNVVSYRTFRYWDLVQDTALTPETQPDWWDPALPWPPDASLYTKERDAYRMAQEAAQEKAEAEAEKAKAAQEKAEAEAEKAKAAAKVDYWPSEPAAQAEANRRSETGESAWRVSKTRDERGWYTIERVPPKEIEEASFDEPQFQKGQDGRLYYRSSRTGAWIPITPESVKSQFNDLKWKAAIKGGEEGTKEFLALQAFEDLLNAPTSLQKADFTLRAAEFLLQAARSPGDYLTIWAMAAGEIPVQAKGPFDPIAPYAQWFQNSLNQLFAWTDQMGVDRDEVVKKGSGQGGSTPDKTWDQIQKGYEESQTGGGGGGLVPGGVGGGVQGGPTGIPQPPIGPGGEVDWDVANEANRRESERLGKPFVPYTPPAPTAPPTPFVAQAPEEPDLGYPWPGGPAPTPFKPTLAQALAQGMTLAEYRRLYGEPVSAQQAPTPDQPMPYWSEEAEEQRATPQQPMPYWSEEAAEQREAPPASTPSGAEVVKPVQKGPGGYDLDDRSAEAVWWRAYAKSGQMPAQTPEQQLEDQIAALYKDIPSGPEGETPEWQQKRREAWIQENNLRQKFMGTPKATPATPPTPFATDVTKRRPTYLTQMYAGQTVPPVARQYPAMGGPSFPSPESWRNLLPSQREGFQSEVERQRIPFNDYWEQRERTVSPTGRNYRRSRYARTPFATVGRP